jgi:hypothetical protein
MDIYQSILLGQKENWLFGTETCFLIWDVTLLAPFSPCLQGRVFLTATMSFSVIPVSTRKACDEFSNKYQSISHENNGPFSQAPVAHNCNLNYLGGWDQEDHSSRPAWQFLRPNIQNNQSKMDWRCGLSSRASVLPAWSCEVTPTQKKTKNQKNTNWFYLLHTENLNKVPHSYYVVWHMNCGIREAWIQIQL